MKIYRCWAIAVPTLFFSIVTDTMHMTVLFLVASGFILLRPKPLPITIRTSVYSIVLSLTCIVLLDAFVKIENRFYLTPSEMGIPTALIFAMALSFFDDRPTISSIILILCIFSIMMCGDITNDHQVANLPLPSFFGDLQFLQNFYIGALFFCIIPFFFLMNRSQNRLKIKKVNKNFSWRFLKFAIVTSSLIISCLLYSPTIKTLVPVSKNFESKVINWATQFRHNRNKTAFNERINLHNSFLMNNLNLDSVLIRVQSDKIPGYLRSRIYEYYHQGSWNSDFETEIMNLLTEEHEYTHNTYSFNGYEQPDKNQFTKMEITYANGFKVNTLLHKGKTHYLEMTCETLNQTACGSVFGKALDFSGGLTLYNKIDSHVQDPFPLPILTPSTQKPYLQIPNSQLDSYLKATFGHLQKNSTKATATALVNYFPENNFTYSLKTRIGRNQEPIIAFMNKKEGHCELYATTTVMALRSMGIAARYVTGFFCSEEHPSKQYYIARSMDLHAWVEYYDESLQKWEILEPTPPDFMPNDRSKFNSFSANWDAVKNRWKNFMSNIVRGYFAESVVLFLTSLFDGFLWLFNSPIKAFISLSILIMIIRKKYLNKEKHNIDQDLILIKKESDRMIKKISNLKDFKMRPSVTLQEIIVFLENRNDTVSKQYAQCLKDYELLRFNQKSRSHEKIMKVRSNISKSLKTGIR